MKIFKKFLVILFVVTLSLVMTMPAFSAETTTEMADMHMFAYNGVETRDELTDSYGNSYTSNILAFDAHSYGYVRYELNGKYESFTGNLVASVSTSSTASMMFSVFADGKEVYTISKFTKQMDAQSISIDLKGVNVLEFMSRDANERWNAWEFITDGVFTSAENVPLTYPEWNTLNDVVLVDSGNYTTYNRMVMDAYGELYHDGYGFDSSNRAYALYNLNNEYKSFTCYIWPQRNAHNNMSSTIKIYANDKVVYTQSGITNITQAIWVELDVTNIKTLKIETYPDDDSKRNTTIYVGGTKLSKHQHTAGTPVVDQEATCTESGTQSIYCTECDTLIKSEKIDALGHTAETKWTVTVEPACTEKGEQVQYCSVCGEVVNTEKIDATGHIPGENWEYSDDGTCNKVLHCAVCGKVVKRQTDEEAEHTLSGEWVITTDAKCETEGEQVQYCSVCGEVINTEKIDATGHTPNGEWVIITEAGCDAEGKQVQYCSVCGEVINTEKIDETGHTPSGEWVIIKEARCDAEGKQVQYCAACGETVSVETIPATEHDYGKWITISGSVWNNPIIKERICSICGDIQHVEDQSTSWLKPLVIVLLIIIFGSIAVIIVTLRMNGLAIEPASIRKLFSKENLTDDDIDDILNKPDDHTDSK